MLIEFLCNQCLIVRIPEFILIFAIILEMTLLNRHLKYFIMIFIINDGLFLSFKERPTVFRNLLFLRLAEFSNFCKSTKACTLLYTASLIINVVHKAPFCGRLSHMKGCNPLASEAHAASSAVVSITMQWWSLRQVLLLELII